MIELQEHNLMEDIALLHEACRQSQATSSLTERGSHARLEDECADAEVVDSLKKLKRDAEAAFRVGDVVDVDIYEALVDAMAASARAQGNPKLAAHAMSTLQDCQRKRRRTM